MKTRLWTRMLTLVLITSWGFSASRQDITGTWRGTLKAGQVDLHVVLHVSRDAAGALKASFDSVDQGAYGIPVTSIALDDSKLSFSIASIHGAYEGTVEADGNVLEGTWTQGRPLPLNLTRATKTTKAESEPAKPSDVDGTWVGTLNTGMMEMRVVFHIWNTHHGLAATLDSPDQGAKGIPVTSVLRDGPRLTLNVSAIDGKYEGNINADRTAIDGTWTQHGASLPLTVKRVKNVAEPKLRRPQNPKGPLPYREREVKFDDKTAGITLAGTITIPPGKGFFPAAVLIAGSGPHNRDEELMGHKPFLVLADYLTRKGIVVLRYDKRGVGQSGGSEATATTADFANDAEAAFDFLRRQPEVNPSAVGLIGHSEGGEIAPLVASRNQNVAFIVLMAGPGVPGDKLLVAQAFAISEAMGKSPAEAQKQAKSEQKIMMLVKNSKSDATLKKNLRAELGQKVPQGQIGAAVKQLDSPWFRYFVRYDPATALEKVECPVLAMIGSNDTQVPARQNLPAIRKALLAGGNKDFEVVEMPGLNHLFQPAKTGAPSEYQEIDTTIAPVALEKISTWILKQVAHAN